MRYISLYHDRHRASNAVRMTIAGIMLGVAVALPIVIILAR